ncbi:19012_t:CDS:10 [Dentiscutata erythropus]|uniref:Nuclear protein localization protein 4 n=1 Tax=Dentiscutata erythropus TaxID=1348616 RepID=A0A9N9F970_9GLOM|nr:19012_t:CDS:10 [Dentiscutata erythropus]
MLVRVRSKQGTVRFEVDPNDDISALGTKIAEHLKLSDYSSIGISDKPTASTPIKDLVGKSISQLGIGHGELVFVTYQEAVASNSSQTNNVGTKASMPSDIKQDPIDDFLEKQDGLIKRGRDSKFCKHAANGMCDYCMPLEPYDINYLTENKIKHMSFHAYLRKINKQNKHNAKFIPPLEEPDLRVKTNCSGTHAPWPEGICTKCQPSAITLQLQQYRMVDHVEFSVPSLIDNFIHFWRSTGTQRFGYLYGRYEHYPDVPLGVKAVVEAIYEPPQEDEVDGLTLVLPWNEEKLVDEVAMNCGLQKVGMIYTDLTDDGSGLGKVICKRHIDSYFLSSQECCFSAAMQNKHPTASKWSASGKFNSRFVTCVVTGNSNGDIDVSAYQVSNICTSMVAEDIIEASVDPSVVRVKESTPDKYVPEVFYKYKNNYGVNVQKSAKPCFPVEYLLVNVTHGFPSNPSPLFTSPISFPIENRPGIDSQDLKGLYRHLGLEASGNVHVDYVSDFHLLTFVKGTTLARLAVSHEEKDANQLAQSTGWQTLVTIMNLS